MNEKFSEYREILQERLRLYNIDNGYLDTYLRIIANKATGRLPGLTTLENRTKGEVTEENIELCMKVLDEVLPMNNTEVLLQQLADLQKKYDNDICSQTDERDKSTNNSNGEIVIDITADTSEFDRAIEKSLEKVQGLINKLREVESLKSPAPSNVTIEPAGDISKLFEC